MTTSGTGRSWAAGYLAGVFDGEGSLYQGPRKDRDRGSHLHLVFSQKENVVAQQATDMFRALNVSYYTNRRGSGTSGDVASYTVNGGVPETLRLLGTQRLCSSALPPGLGEASGPHGVLPVPAPATLELMAMSAAPIRAAAVQGGRGFLRHL